MASLGQRPSPGHSPDGTPTAAQNGGPQPFKTIAAAPPAPPLLPAGVVVAGPYLHNNAGSGNGVAIFVASTRPASAGSGVGDAAAAGLMGRTEGSATLLEKVIVATAYGGSSILIMLVNKALLTHFDFPSPSFVALVQYIATLLVLLFKKHVLRTAVFPAPSWEVARAVWPLPLVFMLNTLTGLAATKALNMPMFVLLRRFSIVMTLWLEVRLLAKSFTPRVHAAVFLMLVGAFVAALGDLQFNGTGYAIILANDLFTALQGVVLRRKLDDTRRLSSDGVMFYNNLFTLPLLLVLISFPRWEWHSIVHFERWGSPTFLLSLCVSGFMGFVLNYTYFLCTKINSPLTTTVIGCIKNIGTTYLGMILFKDYYYGLLNFVGINISVLGSLIYSHAEFAKHRDGVVKAAAGHAGATVAAANQRRHSHNEGGGRTGTGNLSQITV